MLSNYNETNLKCIIIINRRRKIKSHDWGGLIWKDDQIQND